VTIVFAVCAALACVAWLAAEARVERLERDLARTTALYNAASTTAQELLEEVQQRRLSDLTRSRQGFARHAPDRVVDRLARHLQLVDEEPIA